MVAHEPAPILHGGTDHLANAPLEGTHAAVHKQLALWEDMEPFAALHLPSCHIHDGLLHAAPSIDRQHLAVQEELASTHPHFISVTPSSGRAHALLETIMLFMSEQA